MMTEFSLQLRKPLVITVKALLLWFLNILGLLQLAASLTGCCPAISSDSLSIMLYRNPFPTALRLTECHTLFQISQLNLHCITDMINTLDVAHFTKRPEPISCSIHDYFTTFYFLEHL